MYIYNYTHVYIYIYTVYTVNTYPIFPVNGRIAWWWKIRTNRRKFRSQTSDTMQR